MKTKSFFAALLLLMASVQTVCSQSMKVWQNGVYVNYNAFGVDSVTFSNDYDAHLWVDLGLPSGTLWATCNIGANSPEEFGDYFAWGETETKATFTENNYKYYDKVNDKITKYCTNGDFGDVDNKTELEPSDDAATVIWGNEWEMPSGEQFEELINSNFTTADWIVLNKVKGRLITSKSNGNSIFLPAGGYYNGYFRDVGSFGHYWSRSLFENRWGSNGMGLYFYEHELFRDFCGRQYGRLIRPVRVDKTEAKLVTAIVLNYTSLTLLPDETKRLTATIEPTDAANPVVAWESSNEDVAQVINNGLVVAVSPGTCVITCRATDLSGVHAECKVIVNAEPQGDVDEAQH